MWLGVRKGDVKNNVKGANATSSTSVNGGRVSWADVVKGKMTEK